MKVSNCTIAKITAYTLILMMSMILVSVAFINQTILDSLCFVAVILLIFILTKIKIVTYEFSGGCVTIRKIHPFSFKKFSSPAVEFPQNYIRDYNFDQHIVSASLVLKVRSKRNRKYAVKIKLFGFTYAQRQKISTSLISIVSQNNFEHQS
ncbi:hypothetical protein OMO38_17750 [Chryseobacterium sp. 09-1422]|uniref:Uncharacterized protein n=1 Tax=Chryseobacterium kimseyorum TaxID=2984028 RepID=A0ABT3I384_9FLAO|nr:hypothetical protein [Chryseobacterium kimseyorum]MCW3170375.1 hypothetical protein [Chryseobacterium kimseyorum]